MIINFDQLKSVHCLNFNHSHNLTKIEFSFLVWNYMESTTIERWFDSSRHSAHKPRSLGGERRRWRTQSSQSLPSSDEVIGIIRSVNHQAADETICTKMYITLYNCSVCIIYMFYRKEEELIRKTSLTLRQVRVFIIDLNFRNRYIYH